MTLCILFIRKFGERNLNYFQKNFFQKIAEEESVQQFIYTTNEKKLALSLRYDNKDFNSIYTFLRILQKKLRIKKLLNLIKYFYLNYILVYQQIIKSIEF